MKKIPPPQFLSLKQVNFDTRRILYLLIATIVLTACSGQKGYYLLKDEPGNFFGLIQSTTVSIHASKSSCEKAKTTAEKEASINGMISFKCDYKNDNASY